MNEMHDEAGREAVLSALIKRDLTDFSQVRSEKFWIVKGLRVCKAWS